MVAVGRSIINPAPGADIGALMLSYGGGGHRNAGTCQVPHEQAERVLEEIVERLNAASARRRRAQWVVKALSPVISRPTISDWIASVPS